MPGNCQGAPVLGVAFGWELPRSCQGREVCSTTHSAGSSREGRSIASLAAWGAKASLMIIYPMWLICMCNYVAHLLESHPYP